MAKRKIRRVTDLHRQLMELGVEISSAQLSRIVAQRPKHLNMEILDALLTVLDCDIADLISVEKPELPEQPAPAKSGGKSTANLPQIFDEDEL
jgi:DNA-binding Xre family transcriptional regulator